MLHYSLVLVLFIFSFGCGPAFDHKKEQTNKSSREEEKSNQKVEEDQGRELDCSGETLNFDSKEIKTCLEWVEGPRVGEESPFRLNLDLSEGDTASLPELEVKLWMPDHGHGSSPVEVVEEEQGFLVKKVYFIMPGFWEVHIAIDGEEKVLRVDL